MQNLLSDVTDALLADENIEQVRAQYQVPRADSDDLISLIERINQAMVEVQPSPHFARHLKSDLLAERQSGVVRRFRRLPGRVRVAALAALIGGFVLLLRRMFLGDDGQTVGEESSAWQEKY